MGQNNKKEGVVTKIISNRYTVSAGGKSYLAYARGKIRNVTDIYVGDFVEFTDSKPYAVIEEVKPRKNSLVRPYVANVDTAFIVLAKEPEPDFLLADKILVNCHIEEIKPVIVYNKSDIADAKDLKYITDCYGKLADIVIVSAKEETGLDKLAEYVKGRLVCLAGQSAVGKTSLLNAILGANLKTDGLSEKIQRGKNTTRHVEIFDAFGGKIIDTCGFSMLELPLNIKKEELKYYYEDFLALPEKCKYTSCNHISEDGCAVRASVENGGDIDRGRYLRYNEIYKEIKEKEET